MKKISLIILFLIGVFASAKAQSYTIKPDTLINATLTLDRHPPLTFDKQPLILLNGKKIPYDSMRFLLPDTIEDIEVVQGLQAKERYGEEGKNGVLVFTLKKRSKKE